MKRSATIFTQILVSTLLCSALSAQAQLAHESFIEKQAESLQGSCAITLTRQGYDLMQEGSYARAAVILKNAIRQSPNDLNARRYLVYSLIQLGQFQDAGAQLQAMSRAGSLSATDYFLAGSIEVRLGKNEQALKQYRAALVLEPDMAAAKAGIVELYVLGNDIQNATSLCQECLAKSRTMSELQYFGRLNDLLQARQKAEEDKTSSEAASQPLAQAARAAAPKTLIPLVIHAPGLAPPKLTPIATKAKA